MINGINIDDRAGSAVGFAGDVNGDGFDDLLIGANGADPNGAVTAGQSYVLYGANFTDSVTQAGTSSAETLTGTSAVDVLVGGQNDDELVGNGGADVLRGGEGDDILAISDLTFVRVVGGRGMDTLRLDTSGVTLDLTTVPDNRILGIEAIDITGLSPNTLVLNRQELLNISGESNTVNVMGDADDTIDFWSG